MKFTQTDNQITITEGGIGQLVVAILAIIIGIGTMVVIFGGLVPASANSQGVPKPLGFLGLIFLIIGIFITRSAQKQTTVIQKGGNTTVTATKMVGGKVTNASFPTASIASVHLDTYIETSNSSSNSSGWSIDSANQGSGRRSDLSLVLSNNDIVQLGSASGSMGGLSVNGMNVGSLVQHVPLSKEAGELSTFLGVPLNAEDRSSIVSEVKSVVNAFKAVTHQDQQAPNSPPVSTPPTVTQPMLNPAGPTAPQAPAAPIAAQTPSPTPQDSQLPPATPAVTVAPSPAPQDSPPT